MILRGLFCQLLRSCRIPKIIIVSNRRHRVTYDCWLVCVCVCGFRGDIAKSRRRRRLRQKTFAHKHTHTLAHTHSHTRSWHIQNSHASSVRSLMSCEKLILRSPADDPTTIASCGLTGPCALLLSAPFLPLIAFIRIPRTRTCVELTGWQGGRCRRNGWAFVGY